MELTKKESILEALLFAAGDVIDRKTLTSVLSVGNEEIEKLVNSLNDKFINEDRALMVRNIDNGYQLCTNSKYHEYINKLFDSKQKQNLSQAAIETLAVIAYKQPVTRQEVEKIRGVNSDRSISILSEYGLIEDIGRKDAPGRPLIYSTTQEFLRVFGYSTLSDLPKISLESQVPNISSI
jgi:segregation and condensation protein B